MAIRYSGDVEIRVWWDPDLHAYRAVVRDPFLRWSGVWSSRKLKDPTRLGPEARHAQIERAVLGASRRASAALRKRGADFAFKKNRQGRIQLSSVFQSPCPVCPHERIARLTPGRRKRRIHK